MPDPSANPPSNRRVPGQSGDAAELSTAACLAALRGRPATYFANPGNAGDSLIALGAFRLLRAAGIRVRTLTRDDPAETARRHHAIVAGGGNLIDAYAETADFLRAAAGLADGVLVLPHTIRGHADVLGALNEHAVVLCRERVSLEYVRERTPARVGLDHDLALGLDPDRLLGPVPLPRILRATLSEGLKPLRRHLRTETGLRRLRARAAELGWYRTGRADCFREDGEALPGLRTDGSIDVSGAFRGGTTTELLAEISARAMFRFLQPFAAIATDRLHVGIAGALLGKDVMLHDNSYDKNRAVYEFSLAGRFPNLSYAPTRPQRQGSASV